MYKNSFTQREVLNLATYTVFNYTCCINVQATYTVFNYTCCINVQVSFLMVYFTTFYHSLKYLEYCKEWGGLCGENIPIY